MCVNREYGSEQYLAANTREQAKIALKFIKGYAKSLDPRHKHFKILRDRVEFKDTGSVVVAISNEAGLNDGYNPSIGLIDEFHASQEDSTLQVLKSGMAMRENPIMIIISSGGYLLDGYPLYDRIQVAHQQLEGAAPLPDDTFLALYELDAGDDWTDESVYVKANPSYGEIVQPKFLAGRLADSKINVSTQTDFKIKNLDMFVVSKNIWLENSVILDSMESLDMSMLEGEPCYCGVDLSSTDDLTAFSACFPPNEYREYYPDKYIFKTLTWVPQCALETANGNLYEGFIRRGLLKMTSGNSVDYFEILHDVLEFNLHHPIMKLHYDPWNSTSWVQQAGVQGLSGVLVPMSQTLGSFNRGTKTFEIAAKQGQVILDRSALTAWAFANVELKMDSYANVKPVKAGGQKTKKIDPVIAIIEAMSAHLFEQLFDNQGVISLHY